MYQGLRQAFEARFGSRPRVEARAPGRVNLIGEHTDYNQGLVLPCAIDRETRVVAAPRDDRRVRVFSADLDAESEFRADAPERRGPADPTGWVDIVQGPFFALLERGLRAPGLDLAIQSSVPLASGLSSSAALGVAVAAACDHAGGFGLEPMEWARLAHRGESHFLGLGCGLMDPVASALGRRGHALRIDCRSEAVRAVPFPTSHASLLIARSGVTRSLAGTGYRERVEECALALAGARAAGVAPEEAISLRALGADALPALARVLSPLLFRRVRHVVTENARVEAFCAALAAGDLSAAGARLCEGMASLRDDYAVSVPELDLLCALSDAHPGSFGSRLTGAGFGGCTLHLVRPDAAQAVADAVARGFEARFGRRPEIFPVRLADGARCAAL